MFKLNITQLNYWGYHHPTTGKCPYCLGDFGHHLDIFLGDDLPSSWVMFNLEIYQPLYTFYNEKPDIKVIISIFFGVAP